MNAAVQTPFGVRGLGHIPSLFDARDYDSAEMLPKATSIPASISKEILRPFTRTIDQGGLGSCTANAAANVILCSEVQQKVASGMTVAQAQAETEILARLFPYYLARAIDGDQKEDTGTQIRNIYQIFNTFGFPRESSWTYSDDARPGAKFSKMPSGAAFRAAYDQKAVAPGIKGGNPLVKYSRIAQTGDERKLLVQMAIEQKMLVELGTPVSNAFCSSNGENGGKPFEPPTNGKDIAGGHAFLIGGYDEQGLDALNSWGSNFGDGGWFRISWDYLLWSQTSDLWVANLAPLYTGA